MNKAAGPGRDGVRYACSEHMGDIRDADKILWRAYSRHTRVRAMHCLMASPDISDF